VTEHVLYIWDLYVGDLGPVFVLDFFLILVFSVTVANVLEGIQSGSGGRVRVYVEYISTFDLLEQSHCGVSLVVLHHARVALPFSHVLGWMLEDASGPISALAWVFQEILAYRCEVLSAEGLFLLKFLLSVSESASLVLELILALKASEPEPTQFGLDLSLPSSFLLGIFG